jgi:hypothetical protein
MANQNDSLQAFFAVIRRLERERKSRIWSMVHTGPLAHICGPTWTSVFRTRQQIGGGDKIEILLHSGGGHPDVAYEVMKFFRRRFNQVNVIVPLHAKSAATLMCLGADNVFMGELADLGPIDVQLVDPIEHGQKQFSPLDEFKSLEFMREQAIEWMGFYASAMNAAFGLGIKEALKDSIPLVSAVMRPLFEQIDPVEMGEHRRAIAIGEEYAKRMLKLTRNPNAANIVQQIVWSYPAHDYCNDYDEAKELGLPVQRLKPTHDVLLSEAIFKLDREAFHGFAPPETKPRRSVRRAAGAGKGHEKGAGPRPAEPPSPQAGTLKSA